jgi:hypothetical protein
MLKKFIRTLIVLALLFVENSAMGSSAPKGWLDESGHSAPQAVRAAADHLWRAVEIEGAAAFDADYGIRQRPSWSCGTWRLLNAIASCGLTEAYDGCYICCQDGCGSSSQFGRVQVYQGGFSGRAERLIWEQRSKEMTDSLEHFKTIVNSSVSSPVEYQGDANICDTGAWVADGAWTKYGTGLLSVRRDLSRVQSSTMNFVNAHGGWRQ